MKINANNDITIYRGETGAIDFKISQRSDYYVPFLISSARVNPMVCITIGSTRRETKNIVSKQLWLDLASERKFSQTVVTDLGQINDTGMTAQQLLDYLAPLMTAGIMYQFTRKTEVDAGNSQLHFAYESATDVVEIDDYDFIVIMAIDETITLDMMNTEYFYQIELMDTAPMTQHIIDFFTANPTLINKLPDAYTNDSTGVTNYREECIAVINKAEPNHWGYRVNDPLTSPVASVSAIQMLQPPRRFTVQSVVK